MNSACKAELKEDGWMQCAKCCVTWRLADPVPWICPETEAPDCLMTTEPFTLYDCTHEEMPAVAESPLGTQIGGDHYKSCKIQPIEFIEANQLGFLEGCVVKRITRHNKPTGKGRQDIEKAIHELQLLLELRYEEPK